MTDMERMQVYLEMSKDEVRAYVTERGGSKEDALRVWNERFAQKCRQMGLPHD